MRQQFQLQMTKNRTPTPVYLDPGMHPGLEVKGLIDDTIDPLTTKCLLNQTCDTLAIRILTIKTFDTPVLRGLIHETCDTLASNG